MANVSDEFHPHSFCLLVKARGGDTAKARNDMAFIVNATRPDESARRRLAPSAYAQLQNEQNERKELA
jgi:hypothetical protein